MQILRPGVARESERDVVERALHVVRRRQRVAPEHGKQVAAQSGCLACHKFGENGNDLVYGNLGNDTVNGSVTGTYDVNDQDTLDGGAGDDWLSYQSQGTSVWVTLEGGSSSYQIVTIAGSSSYIDYVKGFENILTDAGAGWLLPQSDLTPQGLADFIARTGRSEVRARRSDRKSVV